MLKWIKEFFTKIKIKKILRNTKFKETLVGFGMDENEVDNSIKEIIDETANSWLYGIEDTETQKENSLDFLKEINNKKNKINDELEQKFNKYFEIKDFKNLKIDDIPNTDDAIIINEYYFYLVSSYRKLYPFRDDKRVLLLMIKINDILFNNLQYFKDKMLEYEFLYVKACNLANAENKTDEELMEEAKKSFSKTSFQHILDNRKLIEYYKKKAGII